MRSWSGFRASSERAALSTLARGGAPPALVDYIVAHELAHLRVRGHGPGYWAVVAQAVPD